MASLVISTGGSVVTSVAAGTGLTATPSPITGSGSLAITNTAVTPGSYTSTNLTVNAQGQITAASNGSGSVISTFLATATGLTTAPQVTCRFILSGGIVSIEFPAGLTGISNSTSFGFSGLPAILIPTTSIITHLMSQFVDNSLQAMGNAQVLNTGVVNFAVTKVVNINSTNIITSSTNWTATGTKSISGGSQMVYGLN